MVLKKRLDYGFDGYRVPVIPRAPRSLRVSMIYDHALYPDCAGNFSLITFAYCFRGGHFIRSQRRIARFVPLNCWQL